MTICSETVSLNIGSQLLLPCTLNPVIESTKSVLDLYTAAALSTEQTCGRFVKVKLILTHETRQLLHLYH